ncbi:MAG: GNAT family N-acetyltransferase [Pseudomonadota bacterium]
MLTVEPVSGDPERHRKRVGDLLGAASKAAGYPFEPQPVDLVANLDGTEIGGLAGQIIYGWLWVMLLAVDPAARGRGIGTALMQKAEALAREQGAVGINVDTFAFQAPDFYLRLGFVEVSRLTGPTPPEDRIFYTKRLDHKR